MTETKGKTMEELAFHKVFHQNDEWKADFLFYENEFPKDNYYECFIWCIVVRLFDKSTYDGSFCLHTSTSGLLNRLETVPVINYFKDFFRKLPKFICADRSHLTFEIPDWKTGVPGTMRLQYIDFDLLRALYAKNKKN